MLIGHWAVRLDTSLHPHPVLSMCLFSSALFFYEKAHLGSLDVCEGQQRPQKGWLASPEGRVPVRSRTAARPFFPSFFLSFSLSFSACLPACLPSFLSSFLPSFLSLSFFLLSLPAFLPFFSFLPSFLFFSFLSFFLPSFYLFIYLGERKRGEGMRGGHRFSVPLIYAFIGFTGWLLYVPWQGIGPATLVCWDDALTNWTNYLARANKTMLCMCSLWFWTMI